MNSTTATIGEGSPCDRNSQSQRYDPLACWLWSLSITIPDQTFHEGIFSMTIKDMKCSSFMIKSISSNYTLSKDSLSYMPLVNADVSGISSTCKGKYKSGLLKGTVKVTVASASDETFKMEVSFGSSYYNIGKKSYNIATTADVTFCDANLVVPRDGVVFSGSLSADIIDLFAGSIAKSISSLLSRQLCDMMKEPLESGLTKSLRAADDFMIELITNTSDESNETYPAQDDLLDWNRDIPLLSTVMTSANSFVNKFLDKGVLRTVIDSIFGNTTLSHPNINDEIFATTSRYLASSPDKGLSKPSGFPSGGFNGLFDSLTNGTGSYIHTFPPDFHNISFTIQGYGTITVRPEHLSISGVDSFTNLTLFEPFDSRSAVSRIKSDLGFNMSSGWFIRIEPVDGGSIHGDPLEESFVFLVNVTDVDISSNTLFSIERKGFEKLRVGDVFSSLAVDNASFCFLSTLNSANVTDLRAHMNLNSMNLIARNDDVANNTSWELERDIDELIQNVVNLFLGEYAHLVTDAFDGLVQGPIKTKADEFLADAIFKMTHDENNERVECTPAIISNDTNFVHFDEIKILQIINNMTNDGESENGWMENTLAYLKDALTSNGGGLHFGTDKLEIDVRDFQLVNGNVYQLDFAKPVDHYHLESAIGLGWPNQTLFNTNDGPVNAIASSFVIDFNDTLDDFFASINTTILMDNFLYEGGAIVKYDLNELSSTKLSDIFRRSSCSLIPFSTLQLYDLMGSASFVGMDLNISMLVDGDERNKMIELGGKKLTEVFNSVMSEANPAVEAFANQLANSTLRSAPLLCKAAPFPPPPSPNDDITSDGLNISLLLSTLVGVVSIAIFTFMLTYRSKRETNQGDTVIGDFFDYGTDDELRITSAQPLLENVGYPLETEVKQSEPRLMYHKVVPKYLRYLIPLGLICTIAIFVSSNIAIGATVQLNITLPNHVISPPSLFEFSLGNTVKEMYQAGCYFLMILISVFSCAWPYVKLALMLFAWASPASVLTPSKRENILLWLDGLGKYSLVDSFMMYIMIVAFRMQLSFGGIVIVDVFVNPECGFYSFLFATIMSLVLGHGILFYHRQSSIRYEHGDDGPYESIRKHHFDIRIERRTRLTEMFQKIIIGLSLFTLCFLSVGAVKKGIRFEFLGLTGYLLGEESVTDYSLLSLGHAIPNSVENPNDFGIRLLQATYFIFAVAMPFICHFILIILFWVPMKFRMQKWLFSMAEVANAWSAIEVFLLTVFASVLEISQFAEFIIGDKCDTINEILEKYFDDLLDGDDVCFGLKTVILGEETYLIIGIILNCLVTNVFLSLGHQALHERAEREGQLKHEFDHESEVDSKEDVSRDISMFWRILMWGDSKFFFDDIHNENSFDQSPGSSVVEFSNETLERVAKECQKE